MKYTIHIVLIKSNTNIYYAEAEGNKSLSFCIWKPSNRQNVKREPLSTEKLIYLQLWDSNVIIFYLKLKYV